jgi:hypothetical protein
MAFVVTTMARIENVLGTYFQAIAATFADYKIKRYFKGFRHVLDCFLVLFDE